MIALFIFTGVIGFILSIVTFVYLRKQMETTIEFMEVSHEFICAVGEEFKRLKKRIKKLERKRGTE